MKKIHVGIDFAGYDMSDPWGSWESVGNRKILWGGCKWENVTWVIATVTYV